MAGTGSLFMFAVGTLDLDAVMGNYLGDSQFKKACMIASLTMVITITASCLAVFERVLVSDR